MTSIQADIEGLSELGVACGHHAGQLCAAGAPPAVAGTFQPSAAAVAGVHASADAAEMTLASRMLSTGHTVIHAARGYVATDTANAARIGDIVTGMGSVAGG